MAFVSGQGVSDLPWRDENFKDKANVYPYGIAEKEPYRVACTIRHRVDIQQPLTVFIQYFSCPIETCLSTLIDRTCQRSLSQKSLKTTSKQINNFQTQLTSVESQQLDDPAVGYQYLCCYEQKGLISIAKAMAVVSSKREFDWLFLLRTLVWQIHPSYFTFNDLNSVWLPAMFWPTDAKLINRCTTIYGWSIMMDHSATKERIPINNGDYKEPIKWSE